jgi:hypothetical protein
MVILRRVRRDACRQRHPEGEKVSFASSPVDPKDAAEDALAEAGRLYERYLELADLARLPGTADTETWIAGRWEPADWNERPLGLSASSDRPLGLVLCSGD